MFNLKSLSLLQFVTTLLLDLLDMFIIPSDGSQEDLYLLPNRNPKNPPRKNLPKRHQKILNQPIPADFGIISPTHERKSQAWNDFLN
jgi:hypothetical protein